MPLHPQVSAYLEQQAACGAKPIDRCTPEDFRRMMIENLVASRPVVHVESVTDRVLCGTAESIPARIYRPSRSGSLPALVYFHGGGWVGGSLDTHDGLCRAITNSACCAVISVDYRLAPEHQYPAAAEDAFAATCWIRKNASDVEIDVNRIAVGGDSAGGNLAAAVSLMSRDRELPAPLLQLLLYPILDHNFDTDSYREFAEGYSLSRSGMQWFWNHYLSTADSGKQPYASPLQQKDLDGLPPTLLVTAECDVLRDEGEAYAARLKAAGVPTELVRYEGMIHGFLNRSHLFDTARFGIDRISTFLRHAFAAAM